MKKINANAKVQKLMGQQKQDDRFSEADISDESQETVELDTFQNNEGPEQIAPKEETEAF